MRTLFWMLAILALAVVLTMAAMFNAGYVLLVLPPYRVELSLSLMIFLVLAVFFLTYGLIRLGISTLNLPAEVHAYKQKRQQEKHRSTLVQAMSAFVTGQYEQAERLAASLLDQGEVDVAETTALIAARSAHAQQAFDRRDAYLASIGKTTQDYPVVGMVNDPRKT